MIPMWTACSRQPRVLKQLAGAEFSVRNDLPYTISRVCDQLLVVDSSDQLGHSTSNREGPHHRDRFPAAQSTTQKGTGTPLSSTLQC